MKIADNYPIDSKRRSGEKVLHGEIWKIMGNFKNVAYNHSRFILKRVKRVKIDGNSVTTCPLSTVSVYSSITIGSVSTLTKNLSSEILTLQEGMANWNH